MVPLFGAVPLFDIVALCHHCKANSGNIALYRIRSFDVHDIDSGSLDLHSHALLHAGKAVYRCTPRG